MILALGLSSFWAPGARADALFDAERDLNAAKNKYYETIFALPKRTGDDEVRIYNQLVVPAQQKLNSAITGNLKAINDHFFNKGGPSAVKTPDVVLDGSGIPRLVEYKGKLKPGVKGSPRPSPAPLSSPPAASSPGPSPGASATPGDAGGVDVLDFSAKPPVAPSPKRTQ